MSEPKRVAKVLIVEDDGFMRRYLGDALREAGHEVKAVEDGEAALGALGWSPELVVLDLLMPRRSGLELLPMLLTRQPGVRVLIVSSLDSEQLITQALEAGATDFVTKPFHPSELSEAVARALEGVGA